MAMEFIEVEKTSRVFAMTRKKMEQSGQRQQQSRVMRCVCDTLVARSQKNKAPRYGGLIERYSPRILTELGAERNLRSFGTEMPRRHETTIAKKGGEVGEKK